MAVYDSGKAAAEVVVAAQHLAIPVDEVHAGTSVAGNPHIIVLGGIVVVVQPVLDLHASVRAGEKQRGHRNNIRPSLPANGIAQASAPLRLADEAPDLALVEVAHSLSNSKPIAIRRDHEHRLLSLFISHVLSQGAGL